MNDTLLLQRNDDENKKLGFLERRTGKKKVKPHQPDPNL